MNIKNRHTKKNKRTLYLLGALLLVIVAGLLIWLYVGAYHGTIFGWPAQNKAAQQAESNGINLDKPSPEESSTGATIKKNAQDDEQNETNPSDNSSSANIKTPPSLTLTSSGFSNGTLQVRYLISDVVTNDGTCSIVLSKSGSTPVSSKVATQGIASSSTCAGFDISSNELSSGAWTANLTVSVPGYADATLVSEVDIP